MVKLWPACAITTIHLSWGSLPGAQPGINCAWPPRHPHNTRIEGLPAGEEEGGGLSWDNRHYMTDELRKDLNVKKKKTCEWQGTLGNWKKVEKIYILHNCDKEREIIAEGQVAVSELLAQTSLFIWYVLHGTFTAGQLKMCSFTSKNRTSVCWIGFGALEKTQCASQYSPWLSVR